ncbi:MAG: endonuclease, partial [Burkholderiaceae bacterium]
GACVGTETPAAHAARLARALKDMRVAVWPYAGAVGLVEESDGWRQTHVIDHWFYVGTLDDGDGGQTRLKRPARRVFDIDSYQILVKPVLQRALPIVPVTL